jgi:hypothetical protein
MTTSAANFDNAVFYDCTDEDELSCTTPEMSIEEYIDRWVEVGSDVESVIRIHSPITVEAYRFKKISDEDIRHNTEFAIYHLAENLHAEYGCPDDHENVGMSKDVIKDIVDAILPTIKKIVNENIRVWDCESAGAREYNSDEIITLMREHRPDWFEDNK